MRSFHVFLLFDSLIQTLLGTRVVKRDWTQSATLPGAHVRLNILPFIAPAQHRVMAAGDPPDLMTRATATPATIAVLLGGLAGLAPFALDTYLPAFPEIAASLGTSRGTVQQSLTLSRALRREDAGAWY
jgi:hypothetical protein